MSKLPGKGRASLQREPHMQRCVTSARDGKKTSVCVEFIEWRELGVREAVLIGWSQDRQSCVGHVKDFKKHYIQTQLICSNKAISFSP